MELTREQQELLEFERRWPRHNNAKIQAVREFFQISFSDYEQQITGVLAMPAARAYDAVLVESAQRHRKGLRWYLEKQQTEWT